MCSFRKYPYFPQGRFSVLHSPSPPGNPSLASYFASKILTFKTPLPLGISDDLPWGGYGFFLDLYNLKVNVVLKMLTLQESFMSNQTKVTRVSGGVDWDVQALVPGVIQTQCVQE